MRSGLIAECCFTGERHVLSPPVLRSSRRQSWLASWNPDRERQAHLRSKNEIEAKANFRIEEKLVYLYQRQLFELLFSFPFRACDCE
jgi:hypothetical protein